MSVTATGSTTTASTQEVQGNPIGYSVRAPKQVLDSTDFMKLLSTQMANQDPMKPMEDTAFIAQMASFSSLNQMQQLTQSFATLQGDTAKSSASALLGLEVTVKNDAGELVTGVVSSVNTSGKEPELKIGQGTYAFSKVVQVGLPQQASTPTS